MGRRRFTERFCGDIVGNQRLVHLYNICSIYLVFSGLVSIAKKAHGTHVEGMIMVDINASKPNEEIKERVPNKDTLGLFV